VDKRRIKNKIYFIWNFGKDPYLCTPNRKEGQKVGAADVAQTTKQD